MAGAWELWWWDAVCHGGFMSLGWVGVDGVVEAWWREMFCTGWYCRWFVEGWVDREQRIGSQFLRCDRRFEGKLSTTLRGNKLCLLTILPESGENENPSHLHAIQNKITSGERCGVCWGGRRVRSTWEFSAISTRRVKEWDHAYHKSPSCMKHGVLYISCYECAVNFAHVSNICKEQHVKKGDRIFLWYFMSQPHVKYYQIYPLARWEPKRRRSAHEH